MTPARTQSVGVWLLSIICLLVVFFPVFQGRFFLTGDMRDVTIPLELFFHQEQLQGHLPAWLPQAAFGFPVIAAAQIGFFYPPLLIARFLPVSIYIPLLVILHALAGAIGLYLFARRLGQSQTASLLSAAAWSLGAFAWQHITHLNIYLALAWLPWQLYGIHILTQKGSHPKKLIPALALLFGIPFLIGQLQIPLFICFISGAYLLLRLHQQKTVWTKSFGHLAIIALVTILIASAQLFPTLQLIKYSSRGQGGDFDITRANQYSYPLYHLPTLLFPRFYGNDSTYWGKHLEIEYGFFIGTLPLLLALTTMWQVFKHYKKTSPDIKFFYYLGIICFFLGLGSLSPFRLVGLEPSLGVFSAPSRWLLGSSLALALLAGFGLDKLTLKPKKSGLLAGLLAIICLASTAFLYWPNLSSWTVNSLHLDHNSSAAEKITSLITSAKDSSISLTAWPTYLPILALAAVCFLPIPKRRMGILIISVIELLMIASTTSPQESWQHMLAIPDTVHLLPAAVQNNQARVYTITDGGDTGAYFTNPASRANTAIRNIQHQALVPLIHTQYNIAGTSWPASLDIQAITQSVNSLRGDSTFTIENEALAKMLNIGAVLTPTNLLPADQKNKYQTQNGVSIIPISSLPRASFIDSTNHNEAGLEVKTVTPSHIQIAVNTPDNGQVIVRDTWYPGWHATLDNKPIPINQTAPLFRSLDIPKGEHLIDMRYKPRLIQIGLVLSLLTIGICCLNILKQSKIHL